MAAGIRGNIVRPEAVGKGEEAVPARWGRVAIPRLPRFLPHAVRHFWPTRAAGGDGGVVKGENSASVNILRRKSALCPKAGGKDEGERRPMLRGGRGRGGIPMLHPHLRYPLFLSDDKGKKKISVTQESELKNININFQTSYL